jgi:hypothetical protein
MSAKTRLADGLYQINGSADADGKPYVVDRRAWNRWRVLDSRGRIVSYHFTCGDALGSVEVTR